MDDYISRKSAVDVLTKVALRVADSKRRTVATCINEIELLPAIADVEPVRNGEWNIRLADEITLCLECSACGRRVVDIDLHHLLEAREYSEACRRYPYCHCGAKMGLEEDTCEM